MNAVRAQHALHLYLDVWEVLHPNVAVERARQPAARGEEERGEQSIPAPSEMARNALPARIN